MKTPVCFLTALLVFTAVATAAPEKETLKAELVRTEAEFFRYALEHGFGEGLRAFMADDAFIANSLILGRAAQTAKLKSEEGRPRLNVIRWKPLRADVSDAGDLGYTWGVAEAGPSREGPFKPYGIYVTIWKRQPGRDWKFVYDAATILTAEALEKFMREQFPHAAQEQIGAGQAARAVTVRSND